MGHPVTIKLIDKADEYTNCLICLEDNYIAHRDFRLDGCSLGVAHPWTALLRNRQYYQPERKPNVTDSK